MDTNPSLNLTEVSRRMNDGIRDRFESRRQGRNPLTRTVYRHCFTGSGAVDWLIANSVAENRHDATEICVRLVKADLLQNIISKEPELFEDSKDAWYQFKGSSYHQSPEVSYGAAHKIKERWKFKIVGEGSVWLDRSFLRDCKELHWPWPPFQGQIITRFACSKCSGDQVRVSPYPPKWRNLIGLVGDCSLCGTTRVHTNFLSEEDILYTFDGEKMSKPALVQQIKKFLRTRRRAPSENNQILAAVAFERRCRPPNFKDLVLPKDFMWPDSPRDKLLEYAKLIESLKVGTLFWKIKIPSRQTLLSSVCKQFLFATKEQLRGDLMVDFGGEFAVDFGGPKKELLSIISEEILNPNNGLVVPIGPNGTFHFSPNSSVNEAHLDYFKFYGRFLAKAFLEKETVKCNLTRALFKNIIGKPMTFADLENVDPALFKHFTELLAYPPEDIDSLELNFTVAVHDFGVHRCYELVPNGSGITLTKENLHEYISRYAAWRVFDSVEQQIRSFLEGFYDVLPPQCLALFSEYDMENLLGGVPEIDVDEWEKYTHWEDLGEERRVWFWKIMRELDKEQRARVVQFVTGTAYPPAFSSLYPPFTVGGIWGGREQDLPLGHTCFNRMDMPGYASKKQMKQKLLTAINFAATGFGDE